MTDVLWFIVSVGKRLSAYITGSVVTASVAVYEHFAAKNVPWGPFGLGLAAFLAVAVYRTWLAEHQRVRELEDEKQKALLRATRREALGRFLIKGQELAQRLARGHGPMETVNMDDIDDVEEWETQVVLYLHEKYGMAQVARFQQDALFPRGIVSPQNIGRWREDWEKALRRRCANLEAFIREIPEQP